MRKCSDLLNTAYKSALDNLSLYSDFRRKTAMKKEVMNHLQHLSATFDRLVALLFTDQELELMSQNPEHASELLSVRSRWVKVEDLVVSNVTTVKMVLIHLLWFQHIGRIVIEDIDPYFGAVLLHLRIKKREKKLHS